MMVSPDCAAVLAAPSVRYGRSTRPRCAVPSLPLALSTHTVLPIFTAKADSTESGLPPGVAPSWTTTVFLVVSTVTSPSAPVKAACCAVVPRRSFTCLGIGISGLPVVEDNRCRQIAPVLALRERVQGSPVFRGRAADLHDPERTGRVESGGDDFATLAGNGFSEVITGAGQRDARQLAGPDETLLVTHQHRRAVNVLRVVIHAQRFHGGVKRGHRQQARAGVAFRLVEDGIAHQLAGQVKGAVELRGNDVLQANRVHVRISFAMPGLKPM